MIKNRKAIISVLLLAALALPLFSACGEKAPEVPVEYNVISAEEYFDKTTAGYLSKLVSFFTDYKFVWNSNDTPRIALPDSWYGICKGSDTQGNRFHQKVAKLYYNDDTQLWETYIADAFGIDILNLYILKDMYDNYGGFATKVISEDWVKYGVWDMGGGHRASGAYNLAKTKGYISPFTGAAEYGNRYPWCEEPWIENNTLGMLAAGMPNVALDMSGVFGALTGDSDNLLWTDFIAAMYANAYFESDIPTLIRGAAELFPEDSWEKTVVETSFRLYEENPDNWRRAVVLAQTECARRGYYYYNGRSINEQSRVDVNMAFSILGLLYGGGDYNATCKIFALTGYDARGVCFLPILGIIGGMSVLSAEANEYIWQDGRGVIVNKLAPGTESEKGVWMYHDGQPEQYALSDVVAMYRENFERVLLDNGGKIEGGNYYIPKTAIALYDSVKVDNYNFESGALDSFAAIGDGAKITEKAYFGNYAAQIFTSESDENGISATVSGLTVGREYKMTAYVMTSLNATAYLFARGVGATEYKHASVSGQTEFVRREFVFTATAETMEIGALCLPSEKYGYAVIDEITVIGIEEEKAADAKLSATGKSKTEITVDGKCDSEVYLKCIFANPTGKIVDAKVTVNGVEFGAVPLYKTTEADGGSADTLYIPVLLGEKKNTVTLDMGSAGVQIISVEAVTVNERILIK